MMPTSPNAVGSVTLTKSRAKLYLLTFVILFLGHFLLRNSGWQSDKQYHTLLEAVATVLALLVGVIALVRFYTKKSNTILFIATGFLGTGLLDGYHAIVTSSYFDQLFPSSPPSLIPWSWNASRTFLSVMMLFSFIAWRREDRIGEAGKLKEGTIYWAAGTLSLFSFIFFALLPLPRAHFPEIIFHRPQEFVSALFFLLALVGFLKKAHWKTDTFEHWLIMSLVIGLMAQVMYMSFSGRVFEVMFDSAHQLKVMSYTCVLIGLIVNIYHLFQQAESSTRETESANKSLRNEIAVREETEKSLRESESRYRNIFETTAFSIWEEDFSEYIKDIEKLKSQGITNFRSYFDSHPEEVRAAQKKIKITDVNPATLKLFGATTKVELFEVLLKLLPAEALTVFKEELIAIA